MNWRRVPAVLALAAAGHPANAALTFPTGAQQTADEIAPLGTARLPVGPWRDGALPMLRAEGQVRRQAWQIPAPGLTTLQILAPLRAQLEAEGFSITYECAAAECGGYDFRYGFDVLPGPAMYVDLGDFRYLAAERGSGEGAEHIAMLASRSAERGFVQLTRVGPALEDATALAARRSLAAGATETAPWATGPAPDAAAGGLAEQLMLRGRAVLDDLSFETGSSRLADRSFASLDALAAFLEQNPDAKIVLVGHTDAEGSLEANIALSRKRADAVRQRLANRYGIGAGRAIAEGVGYLAPLRSNTTEAGRTANRRVEVVLSALE